MKVQAITTPQGERYLLLDGDYRPVDEVKRYLRYLDNCGKSPNTLRTYAYHLKLYYEYLEMQGIGAKDVFAEDARPTDILSDFILWLQYPETATGVYHLAGESPCRGDNTVNQILEGVLSLYQYLAVNREISAPVMLQEQVRSREYKPFLFELMRNKTTATKSLLRKRICRPELKFITREQYTALFQLCGQRRDKLLLALLYEGGLRLGEALGLHIEDLCNLEDGIVRIVPRENNENGCRVKRNAAGIIRLPDYVIDLAVAYLAIDLLEYDTDYVFINLTGKNAGNAMSENGAEKLFDRLSDKVGFKVHPHMLRHGFATEKLSAGWELLDIQVYLRHRNIVSTQIYASYTDEMKKEKMRGFLEQYEEQLKEVANGLRN